MDYGTFFFTNIASVTVFTVSIGLLAGYNRQVKGMRWFAAGLIVGLAKLILQGLEGKTPAVWSGMTANELYLVSISLQWMGLHWFVVRKPAPFKRLWMTVAVVLAVYTITFLGKIPYTGNVINIPFVALCGFSAWTLWKHGGGPFVVVSRVGAAILCGQGCVAGYRAILTNMHYVRPWETVIAHNDLRWVYSLAAAAFLAAFMAMCELWFLVTELQRELAEQARTDPLTGALNRRAMEEAALRETARSMRCGSALSMIMIDIDNFKKLNDRRGHAAGDHALQAVVRHVRSLLRRQDLLARTGGEEFAILLPDTVEAAALAIAERVRHAVEELEIPFETGPIRLTVCAGVAQLDSGRGWEAMMRLADSAMYQAKRRGRNLVSARPEFGFEAVAEPAGLDLESFGYLPTA